MHGRSSPAAPVAAAAALALAVAGCGSSGRAACPDGATTPQRADAAAGTRYLTGVTVSRGACGEQVAFAFEHGASGYRVSYESAERAQTEDASGRHLPVAGTAFLVVHLDGSATARADAGTLTRTYAGPRRLAGAVHVREVVKTGDFEAVVTWAIGLDARRPFSVERAGDALVVRIG